jgi:hypothetical protein
LTREAFSHSLILSPGSSAPFISGRLSGLHYITPAASFQ